MGWHNRQSCLLCVLCVCCVCVVISSLLGVRLLVDAPARVTQEEGHTGFLHLPSAMLTLPCSYINRHADTLKQSQKHTRNLGIAQLLLLFLTFSALVANPKKLLYTVANPARGLLDREKKTKR